AIGIASSTAVGSISVAVTARPYPRIGPGARSSQGTGSVTWLTAARSSRVARLGSKARARRRRYGGRPPRAGGRPGRGGRRRGGTGLVRRSGRHFEGHLPVEHDDLFVFAHDPGVQREPSGAFLAHAEPGGAVFLRTDRVGEGVRQDVDHVVHLVQVV